MYRDLFLFSAIAIIFLNAEFSRRGPWWFGVMLGRVQDIALNVLDILLLGAENLILMAGFNVSFTFRKVCYTGNKVRKMRRKEANWCVAAGRGVGI